MAKKYASRPGSRAGADDAAQEAAAAASGRVTRATRSQSREPADVPASTGARGGKQKGGKKGKAMQGGGDLETVDEGQAVENAPRQEINVDVPPQDGASEDERGFTNDSRHARHESIFSTKSATTAKTTFSAEEISEMDPDIMVDVMPSLASAADELIKLLLPSDPKARPALWSEIKTAGTKHNKLYNNRVNAIGVHKGNFGSEEYIQPSFVLRALLGVQHFRDVPDGLWRPDNVIYKVNLATMLRTVILELDNQEPIDDNAYRAMNELDRHFGSGIVGRSFDGDALHLCLAILRQLCITKALAFPNDNASQMCQETFFMQDQNAWVFKQYKVLHMTDITPEEQAEYNILIGNVASEFIDTFSNYDHQQALDHLRAKYPWQQFVSEVITYSLQRRQALDEQIAAVGGIEQIKAGLDEEVERRSNERQAESMRASFSRPGATPKKSFGKGGIKAMRTREKLMDSAAAALDVAASTAPVAQMTDPVLDQQVAPVDDGLHDVEEEAQIMPATAPTQRAPPDSILPALSALQQTQRQNAAKGKGRLVDRQENATRVQFGDGFGTQSQDVVDYALSADFPFAASSAQPGPYYQSSNRLSNKRPHAEMEPEPSSFEPTQDEGFQIDARDTSAADERRHAVPRPNPTPRIIAPRASAVPQHSPRPTASPRLERRNPGSSIPAPATPFDPDDDIEVSPNSRFKRAKVEARHAAVRVTANRPVQARTPWSDDEEMALIALVEEEGSAGIHYASLKSLDNAREGGPLLGRRKAEDLRFKLRNMKVTFLQARQDLPRNFEYVVLDKKAIDKLHALGIPYHQERIRGGTFVEVGGE